MKIGKVAKKPISFLRARQVGYRVAGQAIAKTPDKLEHGKRTDNLQSKIL
jgi:hypothetical protein